MEKENSLKDFEKGLEADGIYGKYLKKSSAYALEIYNSVYGKIDINKIVDTIRQVMPEVNISYNEFRKIGKDMPEITVKNITLGNGFYVVVDMSCGLVEEDKSEGVSSIIKEKAERMREIKKALDSISWGKID